MSRGLFTGDTDYSRQSFDEIIKDIKNWAKSINTAQDFFGKNLKLLKESKYLDSNVPDDFKVLISRTIEIFEISIKELKEILSEFSDEVRMDHVKRLNALGVAAKKLSNDYGITWHQRYSNKEYGNENFRLVEGLYSEGRDELNNMIDLCNLSARLNDFVGKKSNSNVDLLELKPNFFGVGLNFNNILKRFKRK